MKYKHKEVEQFHFIGMVIYLLYDILQDFFFFFSCYFLVLHKIENLQEVVVSLNTNH